MRENTCFNIVKIKNRMRTIMSIYSMSIVNKKSTDSMKYSIIKTISSSAPPISSCQYANLLKSIMCFFQLQCY